MKRSNSSIFYGGITVLIVVASFLYSWKFIIPKYRDNRAESLSIDTKIANANKKLESLKKAQTALVQLGDIPKQLSVAVPQDKDMPNLITELEAVAAKYKIIIPTISITDGSGSTTASATSTAAAGTSSSGNTVTIAFAVPGSFDDINGLISDLEKDIRFMNIKSVSISSTQSQTGGSSMSVALQIEAYKRGSAASSATSSAGNTSANSQVNGTGGL
jgi:Tfp pilus assembly protein PilO